VRHSLFSSIAVLCIYLLSLPNAHAAPVVFDIVGATDGTVSVTGSFAFDSTASYSNLNIMLSGIANDPDDNTTYTSFLSGVASMVSAADNASPEDNIFLEFASNITSISPTAVGLKLVQLHDSDEEIDQILLQNTGSVVPRAVPAPLVGLGIPAFLAVGAGLLGAQLTHLKRYRRGTAGG
jgi:hypothetical protein